jgi:hypothetical protein
MIVNRSRMKRSLYRDRLGGGRVVPQGGIEFYGDLGRLHDPLAASVEVVYEKPPRDLFPI